MDVHEEPSAAPMHESDCARVLSGVSGQQIIFGLEWVPMVGGNPRRLAPGRARALGATHFVLAGSQAVSLGFVRLARKTNPPGRRLHSAAAIFAGRNPEGAAGCLACIAPHGCWVVATHAGTVLAGTDRWFPDFETAQAAVDAVRLRFPGLRLQIETGGAPGALPAWACGLSGDLAQLQHVQTGWYGLAPAARWVTGVALLGLTAYVVINRQGGAQDARALDADAQWREAVKVLARHHPIDAFVSLSALVGHWRQLPVSPAGWRLRQVLCESGPVQWRCAARYARQHRLALNANLERFRPPGWSLHFTPLNDATFSWHVDRGATLLDWFAPSGRPDWMSQLQRINPAFEHVQVGAGAPVALPPPLDASGAPLARPPQLNDWTLRSLVLKGPLRSLPALAGLDAPVRWRRVTLDIERAVPATIAQSILSVHLVGDLYEPRP